MPYYPIPSPPQPTLPLFRGATAVRGAVIEFLEVTVPVIVDIAREEWELDEFQLPYPVAYNAYEPYALDRWPLLGVNVANAGEFFPYHFDPTGSPGHMGKYAVRVFTWVRTPRDENDTPIEPEYSESLRLRDDLGAVVRAALLSSGGLARPEAIIVDQGSLNEDYGPPTGVRGDRWIAGVTHSFNLRYDESVPLAEIGQADKMSVEAQPMS